MSKLFRKTTDYGNVKKIEGEEHGRNRDQILNFRVSKKEKELIERRIELSGQEKAQFFIESCMYQAVLVRGNIKSFDKIHKRMDGLEKKLLIPTDIMNLNPEDRECIRMILEILDRLYGGRKERNKLWKT